MKSALKKISLIVLFTNGTVLVLDKDGKQMPKFQKKFIATKKFNRKLLRELAQNTDNFIFCKFREAFITLTKEEFLKLFC